MKIKKRTGKMSFGILLLTVVAMVLVAQTSALPEYSSELQKIYGNGSCTTCHIDSNGGDGLTGYGNKFALQSNHVEYPLSAIKAIGEPPVKAPVNMSMFVLALQGAYGNSSCTTCHVKSSGGELTEYGKKFSTQPGYDNDSIVTIRAIGPPEEAVLIDSFRAVNVTTTDEKTEKKSPGFEIAVTIGMISAIYMLRRNKIK